MKTIIIILLLVSINSSYGQTKEEKFNTDEFEITYKKVIKNVSIKGDSVWTVHNEASDRFILTDSAVNISSSIANIPLENLERIKFVTGKGTWFFAIIGGLAGIVVTAFIMDQTLSGEERLGGVLYLPLGAIVGSVTGGVIGSQVKTYKEYGMERLTPFQKKEVLKILGKQFKK